MNENKSTKAKKQTEGAGEETGQNESNVVAGNFGDQANTGGAGIYKISKAGGAIETISRAKALDELSAFFPVDSVEKMFADGDVAFTDKAYYATDSAKLAPYAKTEAPAEAVEATGGEQTVIDAEIESETTTATGLSVSDAGVIPGEVVDPATESLEKAGGADIQNENALTEDEKALKAENERIIKENLQSYQESTLLIGGALNVIIKNKLHRETHDNVKDYVFDTFGLTREYAYQLMNAAVVYEISTAGLPEEEKQLPSIAAMLAVDKSVKQIAKETGLDKHEVENFMRTLTRTMWTTLVECAPKDADGKPVITAQDVHNFGETVKEFTVLGVVEIDGEQMPIAEAREKGLIGAALQETVTTKTVEQIKSNKQYIYDESQRRKQASKAPQKKTGAAMKTVSVAAENGAKLDVAVLTCFCSVHAEQGVKAFVNAGIVLDCECLFRHRVINDETVLVCEEMAGNAIDYDAIAEKLPSGAAASKTAEVESKAPIYRLAKATMSIEPISRARTEAALKKHGLKQDEILKGYQTGEVMETDFGFYSTDKEKLNDIVFAESEKPKTEKPSAGARKVPGKKEIAKASAKGVQIDGSTADGETLPPVVKATGKLASAAAAKTPAKTSTAKAASKAPAKKAASAKAPVKPKTETAKAATAGKGKTGKGK